MSTVDVLQAAVLYTHQGFSVIPVRSDKTPHGFAWAEAKSRRLDPERIPELFDHEAVSGVAILGGRISGDFIAIDFDGPEWRRMYDEFCQHWPELAASRTVISGSGRRHIWLYADRLETLTRREFTLRPIFDCAVELRATGHYVVAPPSLFIDSSGKTQVYKFVDDSAAIYRLDDPAKIVAWLKHQWGRGRLPKDVRLFLDSGAAVGTQDTIAFYAGCQLRDAGFSSDETLYALSRALIERSPKDDGRPPWTEEQIQKLLIEQVYKAAARDELSSGSFEPLTDRGTAQVFTRLHPNEALYCHPFGRWFVYDGQRWDGELGGFLVYDWLEDVSRERSKQSSQVQDEKRAAALASESLKLQNRSKQDNSIWALSMLPDVRIRPRQLDQNPGVLNVANGTLDLFDGGALRKHRPEDLITTCISTEYHADAICPRWDQFLGEIFNNDKHLINYAQRAVGYTLSGDTREHCFFYLFGTGRNGKSTFLNVLLDLLGDLGTTVSFSTFLSNNFDHTRNDLAQLVSKRLVVAGEPALSQGRLDESLIKQLTGRDQIMARFLYREFFTFEPRFKVWLMANHRIPVRDTSIAFWERIKVIPFLQSFKGQEDRLLHVKLQSELEGILAWAVRGCLDWQARGLGSPEAVQAMTQEYHRESDPIGRFLEECYVEGTEFEIVSSGDLYFRYQSWAAVTNEYVLSKNVFGRVMTERGIERDYRGGAPVYLRLKARPSIEQKVIAKGEQN